MSVLLTVVCTDRGAHRKHVLGELLLQGNGLDPRQRIRLAARNRPRERDGEVEFIPPEERPQAGVQRERSDGGEWFTFTCPYCGRESRLRDERLMQATYPDESGQIHWRVSSVDVSHLPS